MKKALKVAFGAALSMGFMTTAEAYGNHPFWRQSAFAITGTYTDVSNNGLSVADYDFSFNRSDRLESDFLGRRAIFMDVDGRFDYALGYTYHIAHTATHFFMNYDHYRSTDDVDIVGRVVSLGISPQFVEGDYAHVSQKLDEFRIGLEHLLEFGARFFLDVNAFFEWDGLRRDIYEQVEAVENALEIFSQATSAEMKGWGFGVGSTAHFKPFRRMHWGAFMGGKAILLWAENDFTLYRGNFGPSANDFNFTPEYTESVVGKVDVTFGIDYHRVLNSDVGRWLLEIDLGMRYLNIFNAFKNGNTYYNPLWPDASGITAANLGFSNDWGRMGGFLTFRIGGANA